MVVRDASLLDIKSEEQSEDNDNDVGGTIKAPEGRPLSGEERGFSALNEIEVLPSDEEISNKLLQSLSLSDATANDILSNDKVAAVLNSDFESNKT